MNITKNIQVTNHMLPFFWQHGEEEATLRHYVGVIQDANCNAFCVESRPHPDFCGPKWWNDMDVILDEAEKRGMQVWILDDSHFPTGYANGALKEAPEELCRQSAVCRFLNYEGSAKHITLDMKKLQEPVKIKLGFIQKQAMAFTCKEYGRTFQNDRLLSVTAFGPGGQVVDLTGKTVFEKPEGKWTIAATQLSGNYGPHQVYINMMNQESCHKLIEACYKPHWQHYEKYFGNTIQGFFSDEPELGNGRLYAKHNTLGTDQDLPWSKELEQELEKTWGNDYQSYVPLLWKNDFDKELTQKFRVCYMDCVSRLVRDDFSYQIGEWCRAHGVKYIGHSIEDDDTHTCTGSGLGHYFRGLEGQDWAGIDDIGGQVLPQGEDGPTTGIFGPRNGGFYHYVLGKLAVSLAYFDEKKHGNAMCEIFGNYGWKSGVYEQKYLADHFLVRGVNYYVPHAFSPKSYPDKDCPPHFYAHGRNPQYRAFGELCGYMNRVASCITGGKIQADVAIYYNAESDWAGSCMSLDKPARALYDAQIDYYFLPTDYKERASEFVHVIVPEAEYAPAWLAELENVLFVNALPGNYASEQSVDIRKLEQKVVALEDLIGYLRTHGVEDAKLTPANSRVRVLHYQGREELYFVVNEGTTEYQGSMEVLGSGTWSAYDPWKNQFVNLHYETTEQKSRIVFTLQPRKSLMFIKTEGVEAVTTDLEAICNHGKQEKLKKFTRSLCKSLDYPAFTGEKSVTLPDEVSKDQKKFSGFIRYESTFSIENKERVVVEITQPTEAVEVFINGVSAGIQVVPDYRFDVSSLVRIGENQLRIEVATTLGRENNRFSLAGMMMGGKDKTPTGLLGEVTVYKK